MWDLIVSVPDHCLSFYFKNKLYLGSDAWDLGHGVLQLANWRLEYVKAWRAKNIFWKHIPLHNYQRENEYLY